MQNVSKYLQWGWTMHQYSGKSYVHKAKLPCQLPMGCWNSVSSWYAIPESKCWHNDGHRISGGLFLLPSFRYLEAIIINHKNSTTSGDMWPNYLANFHVVCFILLWLYSVRRDRYESYTSTVTIWTNFDQIQCLFMDAPYSMHFYNPYTKLLN